MNMRLYQAVVQHLRSEALQAAGMIEAILQNPPVEGPKVTELIAEQCLRLVQYEGAIHSLQTYFPLNAPTGPSTHRAPEPSSSEPAHLPPEEPPLGEPMVVREEQSSTMRESLKRQFGDEAVDPVHKFADDEAEEREGPPPEDDRDWFDE